MFFFFPPLLIKTHSRESRHRVVSLASESASLGVATFVTRCSVSEVQAWGAAALVSGVITKERGTQGVGVCVDGCALPGEISYPSLKVVGKVKNLSSRNLLFQWG